MKQKIIIYQLLPRLFSNTCQNPVNNGTIEQNGCGTFNDITLEVLTELRSFGVTHIWLTGIIRHATLSHYPQFGLPASHPDIVKGIAGSPYAVNDYYDTDPDLAVNIPSRMSEFEQLLHRIHIQGLKAIIDFVPNHVARDYHSKQLPKGYTNLGEGDNKDLSFSPSNNYYYLPGGSLQIRGLTNTAPDQFVEIPAKASGNDVFRPDPDIHDWYETVKLNYGFDYQNRQSHFHPLPDTWIKMTEILLFWSGKGVDGFRCDMAGMVPVDFWQYAIGQVKMEYQQIIFIAELYEPLEYRDYLETGFFDYLYDKAGMYDTLRSLIRGESSTRAITSVWKSMDGMDNSMLRFLENHDEQRIASGFFAGNPWKAIPAMAIASLMNQGPVLIYSGQEFGEPAAGSSGFSGDDGRTSIFDYTVIPKLQKWFNYGKCDGQNLSENQRLLRRTYSELLHLAQAYPVFANGYLYDLMWVNEDIPNRDRIFAFLRYGGTTEEEVFMVVASFDPTILQIKIKIPEHAMNTVGFGSRQRITVKGSYPEQTSSETLLFSQIVSVGIKVTFGPAGYCVYSLS
ncbi:MAG: alpha-amylase [Porphyromonadaceae bacterium]|nr:MAG: alpha-amylase [Porphyromonadaceae bacterium]